MARVICCPAASGRNFWPKNGQESEHGSSAWDFPWMIYSMAVVTLHPTPLSRKTRNRRLPERRNKVMACIEARGLRKTFGATVALDGIDLRVEEGRIVGLIGPNGAGKTTALNAMLGLTPYQGELTVLGMNPWAERDRLMRDVCFIADVAVLPRWIRVSNLLEYVTGVHPRFDRAKAEAFLSRTTIKSTSKV